LKIEKKKIIKTLKRSKEIKELERKNGDIGNMQAISNIDKL